MMQGKLIVLEGIDGSGKSTQYRKLCERLSQEGKSFRALTFPRYQEESSALIRQYLSGAFGSKPGDVNAYAASTFYAVDRFASYKTDWQSAYEQGDLILCDRYTTSNACHQGSKLRAEERQHYFDWLYDFEFRLLGLPKPDLVLYLDVDIDVSRRQMELRQRSTGTQADIHERDFAYLAACLEAGRAACAHYGWHRIACVRGASMRPIEEIHEEICQLVHALI